MLGTCGTAYMKLLEVTSIQGNSWIIYPLGQWKAVYVTNCPGFVVIS